MWRWRRRGSEAPLVMLAMEGFVVPEEVRFQGGVITGDEWRLFKRRAVDILQGSKNPMGCLNQMRVRASDWLGHDLGKIGRDQRLKRVGLRPTGDKMHVMPAAGKAIPVDAEKMKGAAWVESTIQVAIRVAHKQLGMKEMLPQLQGLKSIRTLVGSSESTTELVKQSPVVHNRNDGSMTDEVQGLCVSQDNTLMLMVSGSEQKGRKAGDCEWHVFLTFNYDRGKLLSTSMIPLMPPQMRKEEYGIPVGVWLGEVVEDDGQQDGMLWGKQLSARDDIFGYILLPREIYLQFLPHNLFRIWFDFQYEKMAIFVLAVAKGPYVRITILNGKAGSQLGSRQVQ